MSKKPLFLLTNDDGISAPGIKALEEAVRPFADVIVVAPAKEKSATSHSISLHDSMELKKIDENHYSLDGTPADCALFALYRLCPQKPDLVLSGINYGANLGQDTLYSGTVGAAMTAVELGVSSIAFSLAGRKSPVHFESAQKVITEILDRKDWLETSKNKVLNINIPNLPFDEILGYRACPLGFRTWKDQFADDESRPNHYRYSSVPPLDEGAENLDTISCREGYITLSVLQPSLYDQTSTQNLASLIE